MKLRIGRTIIAIKGGIVILAIILSQSSACRRARRRTNSLRADQNQDELSSTTIAPTDEPTRCFDCSIDVDLDCTTNEGQDCSTIVPPSNRKCSSGTGTLKTVTFSYQEGAHCSESLHHQENAMCKEMGRMVDPGCDVAVKCQECQGKNGYASQPLKVVPTLVAPGDSFTVQTPHSHRATNGRALPKLIECETASVDGECRQFNVIDTSGVTQLDIGDTFGPLRVESCNTAVCFQTFNYNIMVSNVGADELEVTRLDFTFNNEEMDLLGELAGGGSSTSPGSSNTLVAPGESISLVVKRSIDVCSNALTVAEVEAEGETTGGGNSCQEWDDFYWQSST